jgi:hypothetical protein
MTTDSTPAGPETNPKRGDRKKPLPGYFFWGGALFFFLFHFAIWPLVWHGVLLPHAQPVQHQLRVESSAPNRVVETSLFLATADSSLTAYAVWQVPRGGLYQLKLSCDDNGAVLIDSRPIITLEGISPNNVGETKKWLTTGPHFLELRLNNGPGSGWLRMEVIKPGRTSYESLPAGELSFPELGNIDSWLKIVTWGEYLGLALFLGFGLLGLGRFYFRCRAGKLFPTRRWNYFFLALAVFALALSVLYHLEHPLPPIWSDGLGYYSYLPAYLIYHDLSMESLYQATRRYDYPAAGMNLHDGEGFTRHQATGRYLVKYPMGTAVLMFPFFLLGHLVSPLLGFGGDGFSVVYQFAVAISSIFYMLGGLFVLLKILIRYFSSKVVTATLLSLFLGTNLLAYTSLECSLSHVYSFFLVSLLLYLVPRWYADPSRSNTLWLGVLSGLIPLVRNTNAPLLVFVPLYGLNGWNDIRERARFLWQEKYRLILLLAAAVLVFSPQPIIWKIATNHFLVSTYTYSFETFSFFSPKIGKVLFSFHHGLLLWSPVLIFSFLGLWAMKGPLKSYRLPIGVCFSLHLYVVSSWYLWYYGLSFGHRAFVDLLPLFALPLAGFYGVLQRRMVKRVVMVVGTFFIALTFFWFFQYFQGVLPGEMRPTMTWPVYKKILLDPSGMIYLQKWLKKPQVDNFRLMK